jgi:hypothetical protein
MKTTPRSRRALAGLTRAIKWWLRQSTQPNPIQIICDEQHRNAAVYTLVYPNGEKLGPSFDTLVLLDKAYHRHLKEKAYPTKEEREAQPSQPSQPQEAA